VPDAEALRQAITIPELPFEVPAAVKLLEEFARERLDPWQIRTTP
jgi:hypothetical protein